MRKAPCIHADQSTMQRARTTHKGGRLQYSGPAPARQERNGAAVRKRLANLGDALCFFACLALAMGAEGVANLLV